MKMILIIFFFFKNRYIRILSRNSEILKTLPYNYHFCGKYCDFLGYNDEKRRFRIYLFFLEGFDTRKDFADNNSNIDKLDYLLEGYFADLTNNYMHKLVQKPVSKVELGKNYWELSFFESYPLSSTKIIFRKKKLFLNGELSPFC